MNNKFSIGRVAAQLTLVVMLLSTLALPVVGLAMNRKITNLEKQLKLKEEQCAFLERTAEEAYNEYTDSIIANEEAEELLIEHYQHAIYTYLDFCSYTPQMTFDEWQLMREEPETMIDNYGGYTDDEGHIDDINTELNIILNMVDFLESEAYDEPVGTSN